MGYGAAIAVVIGVIVVLLALMALGWRGRLRRQADIPAPLPVPEELSGHGDRIPVMYVGTNQGGERFERIAVHQLGLRTEGSVYVDEAGVIVQRDGVPDFLIPASAITGARTESGMTGKFVERDGLVVIGWRLGETAVDTGLRPRLAADRTRLLDELHAAHPTTQNPT